MYKLLIKPIFDIIISILVFSVMIIPFIIIAILIKLDSSGPVFYKQIRIGKNCKEFKIYKFRTMVVNADSIGGYSTKLNDSRITRIGTVLRKTSLDELPQIINVIFGEMSLVGPRPDVPAQKINYTTQEWVDRHNVAPGITGLAQVRNRHNLSNRDRKRYDIFYNQKVDFLFDIKIILWTLRVLKIGSY